MCGVWIDSPSMPPTATISRTSAMVSVAAVAIIGLKLRAVLRYQRLPRASARSAYTSATSPLIGLLEHLQHAVDLALLLALGQQRAGADGREEAAEPGAAGADRLGEGALRQQLRGDVAARSPPPRPRGST